jgi:general stress protein YciG
LRLFATNYKREGMDVCLHDIAGRFDEEPIMTEKSRRGFAAMDPEKRRAVASKGGIAAHAKGTAHRFTSAEASAAGRKGGRVAHARGTAHRFSAAEASAAGRKGGRARAVPVHQQCGAEAHDAELAEGVSSQDSPVA